MKVLSILLIFIYALTADGGAPAISETFNATLLAQYIGGSAMSYILRDANAGKEYWGMYSVEENVYMGQLLDFGAKQSYNILQFGPVEGCMPLATQTDSLPKFWDWLTNASDAGKSQFMNTVVEVWAGKDADGNYREVGVSMSDTKRPIYTVIVTHQTAVQFTWLDYSEDVSGAHFDVPLGCTTPSHSLRSKPSALPGMMSPFRLSVPKPFYHHHFH